MESNRKYTPQRALRDLDIAQKLLLEGDLTCQERSEIEEAFGEQREEMSKGTRHLATEREE